MTHPPAPRPARSRSLRRFLHPYRGSLSLASGLILVETLIDLARPWPLKLAVDNAIGGQPLGGADGSMAEPGARASRTEATTGGSCLSLIVADRCVDPVQAKSRFLRSPILQVGIDELQPRSIGVGQSRHARDKELL